MATNMTNRLSEEYKDIVLIGKGGYGKIFAATHKIDKQRWAIKLTKLTPNNKNDTLKEVQALVNLRHENVLHYSTSWIGPNYNINNDDTDKNTDLSSSECTNSSTALLKLESSDENLCHAVKMKFTELNINDDSSNEYVVFRTGNSNQSSSNNHNEQQDDTSLLTPSQSTESNSCSSTWDPTEYLYIVTELCHEHNLHDRLKPENRSNYIKTRLDSLNIFYQIVDGMAYIHQHEKRLIHRDLKPQNIFFHLNTGKVKIGDFGLAKVMTIDNEDIVLNKQENDRHSHDVNYEYSKTNRCYGTPLYASPEQINGEQPTQKVDIYAMGLILLELLYPISTMAERMRILEDARKYERTLPQDFDAKINGKKVYSVLIRRLIDHDKNSRPTAVELTRNMQSDIDAEDYRNMNKEGQQQLSRPILVTEARSLIQSTLIKPPESQIRLETDEIQYGKFDVCDKFGVLLVCEQHTLKLYDKTSLLQVLPFPYERYRNVSYILWSSFLNQFLVLTTHNLFMFSLTAESLPSRVRFDKLTCINQIRTARPPYTNTASNFSMEKLRFMTIPTSQNRYLFLNYAYCRIEQWKIDLWQKYRQWSKEELNYEKYDEFRLITSSADGSYLAMNVQLNRRKWVVDFRRTDDANLSLLKRFPMSYGLPDIYHKMQIPGSDQRWLFINEQNQFLIVSSCQDDEKIESIQTLPLQWSEGSSVYFRIFNNWQYLVVGTVSNDEMDRRSGLISFYKITSQ